MFSPISTLSFLVLGLFYVCLALPILPEQSLDTTDSSTIDDIAKEDTLNLRLLMNDQTSPSEELTTDEPVGFDVSTSVNHFSEETTIRSLRSFEEYSTSKPIETSTEETINKKRDHHHHHLSMTTVQSIALSTESSSPNKREDENAMLSTTVQPFHDYHSSKSMITTTGESSPNKRENIDDDHNSSFPTTTQMDQSVSIDDVEQHSTYPTETTSTKKFPKDVITKKSSRYPSKAPKEENIEDTHIPTAMFDDQALDKVSNVPNEFLILDESPNFIVTDPSEGMSSSTTMVYREKEALNQGQESSHVEEEESNH